MTHRRPRARPAVPRSAAARLAEAERLYRDFEQLTPYPKPRPFVKSFDSFAEYERWRRAQTNPCRAPFIRGPGRRDDAAAVG